MAATDDGPPVHNRPALMALGDERERVIARLTDAYTRDLLPDDEFESRLTLAHRATKPAELAPLVADLGPATTALEKLPEPTMALDAGDRRATANLVAILGGVTRRGPWVPARQTRVYTCMGGCELDFREAILPPGVTDVFIYAIMGGAQIIVPPNLAIEVDGTAIMGGFEHTIRAAAVPDPKRPRLRIGGVVMMGGVHIETRLPGESEWDARRRNRRERKELRRSRREQQRALPPGGGE